VFRPYNNLFLRRFAPQECGDNSLIALKRGASERRAAGTRQSTSTPAARAAGYRRIIHVERLYLKMENDIKNTNLLSSLLHYSRHAPALIGVAYIIGFIIINSFLPTSSNSDLGLFSVKYLSAGIFYVFILLPAIFVLVVSMKKTTGVIADDFIPASYYFLVTSVICSQLASTFLVEPKQAKSLLSITNVIPFIAVLILARITSINKIIRNVLIAVFTILCWSILIYYASDHRSFYAWYAFNCFYLLLLYVTILKKDFDWYAFIFILLPFIVSISTFGGSVYGNIRQNYGGGAPQAVHFYLTDKKINKSLFDLLKPDPKNKVSKEVSLYLEMDQYYLIKDDGKYYKISKDIIQGYYRDK
jgi:hypothetical protein